MSNRNPAIPKELRVFKNFLFKVWQHLNLPAPTTIQYDIADYLQYGPRRSMVAAFRGVGKSWETAAYVCWRLLLNPQLNILVVSGGKTKAGQFSNMVLQLIDTMPLLQHLRPLPGQRSSKLEFDVGPAEPDQSPSVMSAGIMSNITGMRADLIIPDDIEVPTNSDTQDKRDKLRERRKDFSAILKPGGEVKYLGTFQCEDTTYLDLEQKGYEIQIWPIVYPDETQLKKYGERLAPLIREAVEADPGVGGKPTDPLRFNDQEIAERLLDWGKAGFALQFMLDPSLSDAESYPLKLSDLIVMSLNPDVAPENLLWGKDPANVLDDLPNVGLRGDKYYTPFKVLGNWLPYDGSVMTIDPAGRGKDECGYAVVNLLNGFLYLMDGGGLAGGYSEETLTQLAEIAKKWKVNTVLAEGNFGDGMFTEHLRPILNAIHPCSLEEVKHHTQKEKRIIDTLEPVLMRHKLVVNRSVIEQDYHTVDHHPHDKRHFYRLFHQLTHITKERGSLKHDDRLEAVAMAVNYWTAHVAIDAAEQMQARKDAEWDEFLTKWAAKAYGHGYPAHTGQNKSLKPSPSSRLWKK